MWSEQQLCDGMETRMETYTKTMWDCVHDIKGFNGYLRGFLGLVGPVFSEEVPYNPSMASFSTLQLRFKPSSMNTDLQPYILK